MSDDDELSASASASASDSGSASASESSYSSSASDSDSESYSDSESSMSSSSSTSRSEQNSSAPTSPSPLAPADSEATGVEANAADAVNGADGAESTGTGSQRVWERAWTLEELRESVLSDDWTLASDAAVLRPSILVLHVLMSMVAVESRAGDGSADAAGNAHAAVGIGSAGPRDACDAGEGEQHVQRVSESLVLPVRRECAPPLRRSPVPLSPRSRKSTTRSTALRRAAWRATPRPRVSRRSRR